MGIKKESCDMTNVGTIKKIDDIPELKDELIAVFESKNKKDISRYGLLLIKHVLSFTGVPPDDPINECIDVIGRSGRILDKPIELYIMIE